MNELLKKLNYDTAEYVVHTTIDSIRHECTELYKEYLDVQKKRPEEPSTSGKASYVWANYMINYTQVIKPIEAQIRNKYMHIMTIPSYPANFEEVQTSYNTFKDLVSSWHALQQKYKYSDYFRY